MNHIKDEDIARMIEGNINPGEREKFWIHMDECDRCLSIYTETIAYMEQEEKQRKWYSLLQFKPGQISKYFHFTSVIQLLSGKKYAPVPILAVATLILITLGIFLLWPGNDIYKNQIQYIENSIKGIEEGNSNTFSPSDKPAACKAAIGTGVLVEDLILVITENENNLLRLKIASQLTELLKPLLGNRMNLLAVAPANIRQVNLKEAIESIRIQLERLELGPLFQFGRFLEKSILNSYRNKIPDIITIDQNQRIAIENQLPVGTIKGLKKLKKAKTGIESRNIFIDIKEVIFVRPK